MSSWAAAVGPVTRPARTPRPKAATRATIVRVRMAVPPGFWVGSLSGLGFSGHCVPRRLSAPATGRIPPRAIPSPVLRRDNRATWAQGTQPGRPEEIERMAEEAGLREHLLDLLG